jgi:hypothetical protein
MCLLVGSAAMMFTAAATPALCDEHDRTQHLNRAQLAARTTQHHRFMWVRRWVWDDFWGDYHMVWMPKITTYRTVSYTRVNHKTHKDTISDGSGDKVIASKSPDTDDGKAGKPEKDKTIASVEPTARPQPPSDDKTKLASIDTHGKPAPSMDKPEPAAEKPAHVDATKPVTPAEIRSAVPLTKVGDPKQTLASAPIKSVWGDTLGKVRGVDVSGSSVKTVDAQLGGNNVVRMDPARLKYVKSRGLVITTMSKEDAAKLPKANAL